MGPVSVLNVFKVVIGEVAAHWISEEVRDWIPWLVHRMIRRSIARLPEDQRERYEEEWQSHVDAVPGAFGKLLVAVGFFRAAGSMHSIAAEEAELFDSLRRLIGRVTASFMLLLYLPVIATISLVLYLEGGDFLTRSQRLSREGRTFTSYRFRTYRLVPDAPPSTECSRRYTRIGRFLERSTLSELPEILNLIRGLENM